MKTFKCAVTSCQDHFHLLADSLAIRDNFFYFFTVFFFTFFFLNSLKSEIYS